MSDPSCRFVSFVVRSSTRAIRDGEERPAIRHGVPAPFPGMGGGFGRGSERLESASGVGEELDHRIHVGRWHPIVGGLSHAGLQ
jgi:hypothetical protein